jgi:hypothetical protein
MKKWPKALEIEEYGNVPFNEEIERCWKVIDRNWPLGEIEPIYYYVHKFKDGEWTIHDEDGDEPSPDRWHTILSAVKVWDLKRKLSPNTRETFGDLIDEL